MIEYHTQRQLELERAGQWKEANARNLWLMGAFMSAEDYLSGRLPEMRTEFWHGQSRASAQGRCFKADCILIHCTITYATVGVLAFPTLA